MKITIAATATVAGAFLALSGAGAANAVTTTGNGGAQSGNHVSVQNPIPVDGCGDVTALQWLTDAQCTDPEWANGVSWDGGYTSSTERMAGVSWDGGSFSEALIIGSQFGLPVIVPIGRCGSSAGHDPSSCGGGIVARGHRVTPLLKAPPCSCGPMECSCRPVTCPCGVSHGHHIFPHKPLRHPVQHAATPVASKAAHGAPTPIMRMLPITGVNLAGIAGSGFGLLGTGAGALIGAARVAKRRRRGPA
jgi:hypothetical protein